MFVIYVRSVCDVEAAWSGSSIQYFSPNRARSLRAYSYDANRMTWSQNERQIDSARLKMESDSWLSSEKVPSVEC